MRTFCITLVVASALVVTAGLGVALLISAQIAAEDRADTEARAALAAASTAPADYAAAWVAFVERGYRARQWREVFDFQLGKYKIGADTNCGVLISSTWGGIVAPRRATAPHFDARVRVTALVRTGHRVVLIGRRGSAWSLSDVLTLQEIDFSDPEQPRISHLGPPANAKPLDAMVVELKAQGDQIVVLCE
jgi:hypothetical protein